MDITFEITDPNEHHPNHFVVVAMFETGERMEVIGFKDRRGCNVIVDKLKIVYRNWTRKPRKKKEGTNAEFDLAKCTVPPKAPR